MKDFEVKQKGTALKIGIRGKPYYVKLSYRVARKFTKNVLRYLLDVLQFDREFREYYLDVLNYFLSTKDIRVVVSEELYSKIVDVVNRYCKHKGYDKLPFTTKGQLTGEQLYSLIKTSFVLKLYSLFLYTNLVVEEEVRVLYRTILEELRENGVLKYLFDYVHLKFSTRTSSAFWGWFSANKFQDICYHVLNLFRTLVTTILLQLLPTSNPMAYVKSVVDQSIYYILVDVYVNEVKYVESTTAKLRYTKLYSLIEKHVVRECVERICNVVREHTPNIQWGYLTQHHNYPVFNYVALPFLTKLLNCSYLYLHHLHSIQQLQLNTYVQMVLSKLLPNAKTLHQLLTSYCVGTKGVNVTQKVAAYFQPLYELKHPLANVFSKTRPFEKALAEICSYTYWTLQNTQALEPLPSIVAPELASFYELLYSGDRLSVVLNKIKMCGFELLDSML